MAFSDTLASFGQSIGTAIQVGVWKLGSALGNKDAEAHLASFEAVQAKGSAEDLYTLLANPTAEELAAGAAESKSIYELVESEQVDKGPLYNAVKKAMDGTEKTIRTIFKNFPWFVALAVVILLWWYLSARRARD